MRLTGAGSLVARMATGAVKSYAPYYVYHKAKAVKEG